MILKFVTSDKNDHIHGFRVTRTLEGELLCYHRDIPLDAGEVVLIDRLEPDSIGSGWEDCTPDDLLDWLEENC